MDTKDTLLAYSEWLDAQGLVLPDTGKDKRSHDELARQFIESWEADETRATLAGRGSNPTIVGVRSGRIAPSGKRPGP